MKVFRKRVEFTSEDFSYPEEMTKIAEYVEAKGKLLVRYKTLEGLWEEFSKRYAAGFLIADEFYLSEFVDWLEQYDKKEE